MLRGTQLVGFGSGGSAVSVTNTANAFDNVAATTFTFASQSLGAAHNARKIAVGVSGVRTTATTASVSSLTVAGNSATQRVSVAGGASGLIITAIWDVDLTTGTSGDIVVTFNGACHDAGISVWRVIGANSLGTGVTDTTVPVSSTEVTPSCNAGGAILSFTGWNTTGGVTWSGLTENYDTVGSNLAVSGAFDEFASAQSSLSVTATYGSAPSSAAHVAIPYNP